jgi:hypothetical protein
MLHMGLAILRDMSLETPVAAAAVFLPHWMLHTDSGRPNGVLRGIEVAAVLYRDQGEDS